MRLRLLAAALSLVLMPAAARAQGCDYWVAPPPAGNDGNPGTFASPWATLDWASSRVFATNPGGGCTVWFKDGVYTGANSLYERFAAPTWFKAENRYRAVLQSTSRAIQLFGARNMVFEGFELRHSGPGARRPWWSRCSRTAARGCGRRTIVFRDNVFHDSFNNDILKINNGARFVTRGGQRLLQPDAASDEHIDVNSVTDVVIADNVFFNDFAGSGRVQRQRHQLLHRDQGQQRGRRRPDRQRAHHRAAQRVPQLGGQRRVATSCSSARTASPSTRRGTSLVENNLMLGQRAPTRCAPPSA